MKTTDLNPPYGGTLIQRIANRSATASFDRLPVVAVNSVVESDLINIATGVFSPLEGFMDSKDFQSVCTKMQLASGLPWTLPVVIDITAEEKHQIAGAARVLLSSAETGKPVGVIELREVYEHDRDLHARSAFGVLDKKHPGVSRVLSMGPYLLAGNVSAFREALSDDELAYPEGVRRKLAEMGLAKVAGFQTRNVVHRAHEYLQRVALEVCDGLLVHPVVGWKKSGDFRPEAVKESYRKFIPAYYPPQRALLAFLKLAMRYAGPKEAVFHAIIRKNYGCSHFIVGRDHAGVGDYYAMYAAHEIFDRLPDLGIQILRLRGPFYCRRCESIATENTCGHGDGDRELISGTTIRRILTEGRDPAHHIFRPEVLASLEPLKKEGLFYE